MKDKKTSRPIHICDYPDCSEEAQYRAPKDRQLTTYYWFCLKHVTEYNKNWDFYKGLSSDEIEAHWHNDITWQRPTWKLGHGGHPINRKIKDSFHVYEETGLGMSGRHNPPQPPEVKHEKTLVEAVGFMELTFPLTEVAVKKQYKKLAKKYHPDVNGGDKAAEKRFQKLTKCYHYILKYLGKEP